VPYTAQQIVQKACAIAKAPGFVTSAGQYLNMILADLCQTYDFDFIRETLTLQASPVPANGDDSLPIGYSLASDHLRTREVFYYVNGEPFYLTQMPIEKYDQLYNGPGVTNYPTMYSIRDETTPYTIYFYEPLQIPLTIFVRYQPQMADIPTPETSTAIPWFINQRYLLKKLAADLMNDTDDARQSKYETDAEEMLRKFLVMKDDKENYAQTIKLDRNVFRGGGNLKATKQQPL
jgi:hypothetical protein